MLKAFRDNLKSFHWVLWVVIAAFVLLAFAGLGGMKPDDPNVYATVGHQKVTRDEIKREYQQIEAQYRQMFGEQFTPEMAEQFGLEKQALERLINRKVLLAEASRLGLTVTDEELRDAILGYAVFKGDDGKFVGREIYERALRSQGFTPETFEAAIRDDLLQQKISQVLAQNLYLSDAEVERAYRERVEKASIRFLQLPTSRFAAEAKASREELQAYLAAHAAELRLPDQRQVAYLLVDQNRLRGEVQVPDDALRTYYDEHRDDFTQPEQVQARHILVRTGQRSLEEARQMLAAARRRIEGGEDFAGVAREVSEDPGSAARGGDLGWFGREQMVASFTEAAFGAAEGELVGPVETDYGVHLIEVTGHREGGVQPFDEAREQIRQQLAGERVGELAQQQAAELVETLRAGEPGQQAMQRLADQRPAVLFQESPPFALQDPVTGIGRSPEFNQAAFALEQGKLSDPVQVPRGWAVLYVEQALAPRDPTLDEAEPRVRAAVETEKRKQMAIARLAQARQQLTAGEGLDAVAAELGVEVQESGEFGAEGPITGLGAAPEISRAALSMDEGEVGGPLPTAQGAVLFEVTGRTRYQPEQFASEKETTRQQLTNERINLLLAALIQQRREEIGVTYSRQAVESLGLQPAGGTEPAAS